MLQRCYRMVNLLPRMGCVCQDGVWLESDVMEYYHDTCYVWKEERANSIFFQDFLHELVKYIAFGMNL